MVMFRLLTRLAPGTFPESSLDTSGSILALRWSVEVAMLWVRWGQVPLFLALPLLFPTAVPLLAALLALGLALGNVTLTWLIRQPARPGRLRLVSGLATALDWSAALALIALLAHRPMSSAPAGLLLLLPLAGLRYGWPGLLAATTAIAAILGVLVTLQLQFLPMFPAEVVLRAGSSWAVFLALTLAISGGLLTAGRRWRRQEEMLWQQERAAQRRSEYHLSPREWELLPWLAREELTYDQIGAALHIRADTVKTHVQRIGSKLGTSGSRAAVVMVARERGML